MIQNWYWFSWQVCILMLVTGGSFSSLALPRCGPLVLGDITELEYPGEVFNPEQIVEIKPLGPKNLFYAKQESGAEFFVRVEDFHTSAAREQFNIAFVNSFLPGQAATTKVLETSVAQATLLTMIKDFNPKGLVVDTALLSEGSIKTAVTVGPFVDHALVASKALKKLAVEGRLKKLPKELKTNLANLWLTVTVLGIADFGPKNWLVAGSEVIGLSLAQLNTWSMRPGRPLALMGQSNPIKKGVLKPNLRKQLIVAASTELKEALASLSKKDLYGIAEEVGYRFEEDEVQLILERARFLR